MDFLLGYENKKQLREYERIISSIEKYSKKVRTLSKGQLKGKTLEFKKRIADGESLDDILPEAYAVVREASRRYIGIEQYPVQLMGAIALHRGDVAEMKTGEGKTYTAPVAAYLNALTGKSVHIATSNDTLATRDAALVKPIFEELGLTVGVVTEERGEDYKKDIKSRQEAYSCDITYGSGNAFAFDYLRDNTTYNPDNVVRPEKEVGFIIIDEADQILVNDAIMPFKLSGSVKKTLEDPFERALREQDELEQEKKDAVIYSNASAFVYKLFKDRERVRTFKTEEQMNLYLFGNEEEAHKTNRMYSVVASPSNAASLTERGWLEALKYFAGKDIYKLINKNPKAILDNSSFKLDKDYTVVEDSISLTLSGLEKAVREIPEVRNLNNLFYSSSEFSGLNKAIDNALKAYFVLEQGREYILTEGRPDSRGVTKKKVLLVSNGRTAEGRVYSEGLQQAIELKEKRLDPSIVIEMSKEHAELASISQKSFYSIYPKIAGMTGTSAKELFEEVYGMSTISIPKNSEYEVSEDVIDEIYSGREDKPTVLFDNDKEKMAAVISSVLESIKIGQPVLIGTLSVNESNKLYEEFKKRGIPCEVLNAATADIAKENEIISRAGIKGSVTISTQMAGRGTDIKLGGDLDYYVEQVKKQEIDRLVQKMAKEKGIASEEAMRQLEISATSFVERIVMDDVKEKARGLQAKAKEDLVAAGGLKVIGYGHYSTKRDDDQLRGRASRQADPGVTEFCCSVKDLKKSLAVSNDRIKFLRKKGLDKGSPLSGEAVEKVISSAQNNMESLVTTAISNTQESDYYLSQMRKKVYKQRMRMLNGESPKENFEYIIQSSVVNLIDKNVTESGSYIKPSSKIKRSGINVDKLIDDVIETFGIDLTRHFEEGRFVRVGDIEKFVSHAAKERYYKLRETNGAEKQDMLDRNNIIGAIDSAWSEFNGNLDYIKFQNNLNGLAQNKDFDEIVAMKKGFNACMADAKIGIVSKLLGKPNVKTKKEVIDESLEVDESLNDYYIQKAKPSLSVRPTKLIGALVNKCRLVKDGIRHEFELVEFNSELKGSSKK